MIPFWWGNGQHHKEVMASIRKKQKQKEKPFTRDDQGMWSHLNKREKKLVEKSNNCGVIITEEQLYDCSLRPIIYK